MKVKIEKMDKLFHDFKKYHTLTMKKGKEIMDEFEDIISEMELKNGEKNGNTKKD